MILDRFCSADNRVEPGMCCPPIPLFQEPLPGHKTGLVKKLLERQADVVGSNSLQITSREAEEPSLLRSGQVRWIGQPQEPGLLQDYIGSNLLSPNLINSIIYDLRQMEPVEGDLCVREMTLDPLDKGPRHVAGHPANLLRRSTLRLEVADEMTDRGGVLASGRENQSFLVQIEKEGHISMAPTTGSFIHPDGLHVIKTPGFDSLPHIMPKNSPNPGVMLADLLRNSANWHLLAESHDKSLKQEGKTGPRAGPGNLDFPDGIAGFAVTSRDPSMQESCMLEEVQMSPTVLRGVVSLAETLAIGTGEETARFKVEMDIQALLGRRELDPGNLPRRNQAQGSSEEFLLSHVPFQKAEVTHILSYPRQTAKSH